MERFMPVLAFTLIMMGCSAKSDYLDANPDLDPKFRAVLEEHKPLGKHGIGMPQEAVRAYLEDAVGEIHPNYASGAWAFSGDPDREYSVWAEIGSWFVAPLSYVNYGSGWWKYTFNGGRLIMVQEIGPPERRSRKVEPDYSLDRGGWR